VAKTILKRFKFVDLFAGIGGFRLGLERIGGKCVFGSEIDPHARAVYEMNFGEEPAGDIFQIAEFEVPEHDVVCGGFPCQPFSISGKQLGFNDARGTLFFEILRLVNYRQPKAIFLENVANYVGHKGGETLRTTVKLLEKAGYWVDWRVLNASNYGVPQARKRLYIVGIRNDFRGDEFVFPNAIHQSVKLKDYLLSDSQTKHLIIDRNDIRINGTLDPQLIFDGMDQKPIRVGILNKGGQGERIYSTEGHAITLSAHGGGAGAKTGCYLINGKVRKLHPKECKRLMDFPDNFKLHPNPAQSYKQFGNAVVVKLIELIGKEILKVIK
jgi:DNA (cytosine-5)-methyltransferase 1